MLREQFDRLMGWLRKKPQSVFDEVVNIVKWMIVLLVLGYAVGVIVAILWWLPLPLWVQFPITVVLVVGNIAVFATAMVSSEDYYE